MATTLRLWFITDGRPGHLNQLRGLAERLEEKVPCQIHWLDISQQGFRKAGRRGLCEQFAASSLPDWVVAAGSRCHLPLLWAAKVSGARSLVLMKPSLPRCLFDAAIIPEHDAPPVSPKILVTRGVLNVMQPTFENRDKRRGLIVLGGVNKHFAWDNDAVLAQVLAIANARSDLHWTVSDSPRTPPGLLEALASEAVANIDTLPFSDCPPGWLRAQLAAVAEAWVSRDSVSMVYESITSAVPTGLLALPPLRDSRVTRSMASVLAAGLAKGYESWSAGEPLPPPAEQVWEADRAADWLLNTLEGNKHA